jgi:uncharacterized membrane protein YeaQ/YmgE (transglycosylase-associated protein family)
MEEEKRPTMSFLAWMVLGLMAGLIGRKVAHKRDDGLLLDLPLGALGAVVGGLLFNAFGNRGVSGFNVYSLFVAVAGSALVLMVYYTMFRRA